MLTWIIGLVLVMVMIALGLPIAFSMAAIGYIGLTFIIGTDASLAMIGQVFFDNGMKLKF